MELVYLWVEDYKNIKNQGFNFSPRFTCNYDKDSNNLIIDEDKKYVSIFPENINITAIVGENGSGKTSLLNVITDMNQKIRKILIYSHDNNLYIKHTLNEKLLFGHLTIGENKIIDIKHNTNIYDFYINNYQKIFLVNKEKNYNSFWGEVITVDYRKTNTDMQLIVNLLKNNSISIPFDSPKYLLIDTISSEIEKLHDLMKRMLKEKRNFNGDIFSNIDYDLKEDRIKLLKFNLMIANSHLDLNLNNFYSSNFFDIDLEDFDSILTNFQNKTDENKLKTINYIVSEIENKFRPNKYFTEYKIAIEDLDKDFIKNYRKITYQKGSSMENDLNFLNFRFDIKLSDGEYSFLLLFSRIFDKYYKNNALILIDEGEISLHPNWQKKYLNYLYEFSKNNYEYKNIQFILSSHSPFILSDLPKENVIFLKNGKQENPNIETFGANIHTLLSHGFFMKDGLMGEFAKEKINEVIDCLKKEDELSKEEFKHCTNVISLIGEPVLQNTLQAMLNEKVYGSENELQKLERKQKEIEKQIQDIREKNEKS
ncbi:AAA family ATPase [Sulfurospirillum arcachonense]|uniref:AAA family ATPase n=1 Tax=Sulfurospirillum arcachonense TaxID=57666 RepID=UPI000468E5B3|nr:AAA family ATPase [Sulfurospirillum arcachonense]